MRRDVDELALNLAEGGGSVADRERAVREPELATRIAQYQNLLGALARVREPVPDLPDHLRRWAGAWVDTRVSEPESLVSRILRVLATNSPAPAVRNGHAGGSAVLYGDDGYHLDLRVEPAGDRDQRLRGQLINLDGSPPEAWVISVVAADGTTRSVTTGPCGEFAIEGLTVTAGTGLVAHGENRRLVVPRLEELESDDA